MAQALLTFLDRQYLSQDGVERKFVKGIMGIFGHGNVTGIGQALEDVPLTMQYVQGHNEQGMVHAAVAYAKQMNRLEIFACTSSIGPGALNMVTAAATATVNRIPVLLLPGDVFACRQPDPVLQQIEDPTDYTVSATTAFKSVSRYWDQINRPDQLMKALMNAMRVLTDPVDTGAVTLALPQDVQTEAFDYPVEMFDRRVWHIDRQVPPLSALKRGVDLIVSKKRPIIICGGGVHYSLAQETLKDFAEQFGIPVVETQAGKSALAWDHPWNLGSIGVTGSEVGNAMAKQADLIIAIGTRLSDFTTASKSAFHPQAEYLNINVNRLDAMKMLGMPLIGDAKETVMALARLLAAESYHSDHRDEAIARDKQAWNAEVDRLYSIHVKGGLAQTQVIGKLNQQLDESAVIVAAAGGLPGDLHRLWRSRQPKTYHMEYGFSCMGYEIAGAFGVKLAQPDTEVYALVGDGSYLMLHSELLTSLQEGCKINIILFDNSGYQCIHQLQRAHGSHGFGNELRYRSTSTGRLSGAYLPIDFAGLAAALGAKTYRVTTPEELDRALASSKNDTVSTLIDIKVLPDTGTEGYGSWWRVGVSEVSDNPRVKTAYESHNEQVTRTTVW